MEIDENLVSRLRAAGCVFARDEARMLTAAAGSDPDRLARMTDARISGAPLEQVLGWAEFWGRRWSVARGLFVPRHRSELLVREALAHARARSPRRGVLTVVDLCCGVGALGGSVALDLTGQGYDVVLHAVDVDGAATARTRKNLAPVSHVHVYDGDLDAPLPASLRGQVDVLLCNAPYVPTDAIALMPREARDHEPRVALDGGPDGLGVLRRAIAAAPGWLRPGGALLFETGRDQAGPAAAAARAAGLLPRIASDDDLAATTVVARRPAPVPTG